MDPNTLIRLSSVQGSHRVGEGDHESGKSKVRGWGVADHSKVAKERIQPLSIEWDVRNGASWPEDSPSQLGCLGLQPEPSKGVGDKQRKAEEECGCAKGHNQDHGHQIAVPLEVQHRHQQYEARHQPGPKQNGAGLAAPESGETQERGGFLAGDFCHVRP